jgi:hypothetical protein
MARLSHSQSSDQPAPGAGEPHPASYHFDPKLGDPRAAYTPADVARPEIGRPEMPARFVVTVEGETYINTMWGKRIVRWRSEPGTPCVILGYWADGTVDLRWPAIVGAYRVEGRFPAWVIVEDPTAKMAGGGHVLMANDLDSGRPTLLQRALGLVSRLLRGG